MERAFVKGLVALVITSLFIKAYFSKLKNSEKPEIIIDIEGIHLKSGLLEWSALKDFSVTTTSKNAYLRYENQGKKRSINISDLNRKPNDILRIVSKQVLLPLS